MYLLGSCMFSMASVRDKELNSGVVVCMGCNGFMVEVAASGIFRNGKVCLIWESLWMEWRKVSWTVR
jgi:hypothetical protein